jgi:CheY-like chemotaxis protein
MGRVMVVDDDWSTRRLLTEVLHERGYTVIEASDGAVALGILRKGPPPDLILLDWHMLPMSGREVASAYRQLPAPHAPIVVLTAGRDAAHAASEIDAAAYLAKPFALDDLDEIVDRLAGGRRTSSGLPGRLSGRLWIACA